ncbi:MAG: hypothetical protein NTU73_10230 [Ignavibacteriae bacterium]|nr:hypothetical protein [Ignavibacteriota bacterium]
MKKISLILSILFFIVIYYGCSDDTVTEQKKSSYISSSYVIMPDSINIFFFVRDSAVTFSRLDSNLQFTNIPKIIYNINPTNGSGDIILRNNLWENIYSKHFTGYMSDSSTLTAIPWLSYLTLTNYTGTLYIKVVRNN